MRRATVIENLSNFGTMGRVAIYNRFLNSRHSVGLEYSTLLTKRSGCKVIFNIRDLQASSWQRGVV